MKNFITTYYGIHTDKMKTPSGARFVLLTDLHGITFGQDNEPLLQAIESADPDAVLVTGDMMVRSEPSTLKQAENLLKQVVNQYKVYYSLGNHEYKLYSGETHREEYLAYESILTEAGVCFLHNERTWFTIGEMEFTITGLEIPMIYYHKPNSPRLTLEKLEELVGEKEEENFHILLAHNPKYGKTYLEWGADLILSGHYHGGVLRLSKHVGLTSPQFLLFPPTVAEIFTKGTAT